jgi:hypothetical protein
MTLLVIASLMASGGFVAGVLYGTHKTERLSRATLRLAASVRMLLDALDSEVASAEAARQLRTTEAAARWTH